jgi:hypothetical protein
VKDEDPTKELRADQLRREHDEHELEERAMDDADARQHARRAEKAQYLADKLAERAESERDAGPDGDPDEAPDA